MQSLRSILETSRGKWLTVSLSTNAEFHYSSYPVYSSVQLYTVLKTLTQGFGMGASVCLIVLLCRKYQWFMYFIFKFRTVHPLIIGCNDFLSDWYILSYTPINIDMIAILTNHNCVWDLRRNFKIDNDSTQEVEMTLFGIFGPLFRLYKYICTICPYTRCV